MYHGSMVALVTPMWPNGDIDFKAFSELLEWHIASGTQGVIVLGTTGETPTLSATERIALIEVAIDVVKGRVPVIIGTGTNATRTTIANTQQAMNLGADAALIVTPYYNKPTQQGLYQHFKAVADAVVLPQILYNVPGRTACDLADETTIELAKLENIVALKDATGDLKRLKSVRAGTDQIDILSGDDGSSCDFLLQGGKGVISVTANVLPAAMRALCDAALSGDKAGANKINAQLADLNQALFCEANPIPVKWALASMGRIQSGIRLPLTPLLEQHQQEVSAALTKATRETA